MNEPDAIAEALDELPLWFVVGLGENPQRDAYRIAALLQSRGKRVIPVHPRAETVHGEPGFPSVAAAAAAVGPPDVVDVFVRSDRAGAVADDAIAAGARTVWFQLGVVDQTAADRVEAAGLRMVMDRCPAIEWRRGS
jgi:predicted CoA-binding protein